MVQGCNSPICIRRHITTINQHYLNTLPPHLFLYMILFIAWKTIFFNSGVQYRSIALWPSLFSICLVLLQMYSLFVLSQIVICTFYFLLVLHYLALLQICTHCHGSFTYHKLLLVYYFPLWTCRQSFNFTYVLILLMR